MTKEEVIKMINIKNLKHGDKILVECTVEAVFVNSGMVMITTRDCNKGFDAYIDEIKSVTPQEPRTGHWITNGNGDGFKKWHCSICNSLVRNSQKPWYKYCPNCGADMREVEE